jgi:hypothetical protein
MPNELGLSMIDDSLAGLAWPVRAAPRRAGGAARETASPRRAHAPGAPQRRHAAPHAAITLL